MQVYMRINVACVEFCVSEHDRVTEVLLVILLQRSCCICWTETQV